jgi:hypothetical protein
MLMTSSSFLRLYKNKTATPSCTLICSRASGSQRWTKRLNAQTKLTLLLCPLVHKNWSSTLYNLNCTKNGWMNHIFLLLVSIDRLCGLVVRVPGYRTEMYCVFCEVRTEFICYVEESRPLLWSNGQVRVRFPALPDFLRSSESGTESTQPREYNWGATWKKQ